MEDYRLLICGFTVLCVGVLLFLLFRRPRAALWFVLRMALGWGAVWLINYVGESAGIHLGENTVNAGMVGLLGMPGVGLAFMLRRLFVL